jgi:hypothetical protein
MYGAAREKKSRRMEKIAQSETSYLAPFIYYYYYYYYYGYYIN